jgi:hypothetical protein
MDTSRSLNGESYERERSLALAISEITSSLYFLLGAGILAFLVLVVTFILCCVVLKRRNVKLTSILMHSNVTQSVSSIYTVEPMPTGTGVVDDVSTASSYDKWDYSVVRSRISCTIQKRRLVPHAYHLHLTNLHLSCFARAQSPDTGILFGSDDDARSIDLDEESQYSQSHDQLLFEI